MQLILNTDTDIGVQKKMSTIEQESLEEKFIIKDLIQKLDRNIDHISNEKDNSANNLNITEICNENGNSKENEKVSVENDEVHKCIDESQGKEKKESSEANHIQPDENIERSKLDVQSSGTENSEIESKLSKENNNEKNENECTDNEGNKNEQINETQEVNGESEEKNNQAAIGCAEETILKERVTECETTIGLKVEEASINTILEKNIPGVDKNEDIGEQQMKFEKSHIDDKVIVSSVETCDESANKTENSCTRTSFEIMICDTESKTDVLQETQSEQNIDMKENSNIIDKDIGQDEEHVKKKEHNVDIKMAIDDEIVLLSDKDKKGNQILQDIIDVHVPAACDNKEIINFDKGEEVIDIADDLKEENSKIVPEEEIPEVEMKHNECNFEKIATSKEVKETDSKIENEEIKAIEESHDKLIFKTPIELEKENFSNEVGKNKKFTHLNKLSNTLDILSDDEDPPKDESHKDIQSAIADKQCIVDKQYINIEDDDDIMLIDEEPNTTSTENKSENQIPPLEAIQKNNKSQEEHNTEKKVEHEGVKIIYDVSELEEVSKDVETDNGELEHEKTEPEESVSQLKPLLPVNFLKTFKKVIPDMTRDELEEFCILKIVESVVDRSNLSEIKLQLKTMAQNLDEYKKKVSMVSKQNRDLQVVLKSVQEEQKKRSDTPITPLKITRSVGMQVLMNDKIGVRRKPLQATNTLQNNLASNSPLTRPGKSQSNQTPKTPKVNSNSSATIPVPRLVPAVNNSNLNNVKIQPVSTNTPGKSVVVNSVSSGPPPSLPSTPKPEKRPHNRIQQNNSVTVDLTDDEPPTKIIQRNVNPPVRLVNPQNLVTPQIHTLGSNINSPRKVYIPISGSQNQSIRPGQTIMLKTISPQGLRQRCPTPNVSKPNQAPNTLRMQRPGSSRHPAPLPDSMKQYQPPNWKALPPAPELKLSKVENGIVISWKIDGYQEENHEEIASYQLYAYQETMSPPSTALWKKIGDVKALPLPMACTLTQFMAGYKYYFAVRAVDVRSRLGPFSLPGSILLLNKM